MSYIVKKRYYLITNCRCENRCCHSLSQASASNKYSVKVSLLNLCEILQNLKQRQDSKWEFDSFCFMCKSEKGSLQDLFCDTVNFSVHCHASLGNMNIKALFELKFQAEEVSVSQHEAQIQQINSFEENTFSMSLLSDKNKLE